MDPSRRSTREERVMRRAEKREEQSNRELAAERWLNNRRAVLALGRGLGEMVGTASTRAIDSTVGIQEGIHRSCQGGSRLGTRSKRRVGATLDEVGVLEVCR